VTGERNTNGEPNLARRRTLVLSVDRDNDLQSKAGISGPVIGREENIAAATKLALADPEEPDANTIFEAVRIFDELAKEQDVQVATVTGNARLGYAADREVQKQIERVLTEFRCDSCIFVSDGEADEQVIPIIQSLVRIESVRVVVMKQAKELEKTYFVLLEKLKEPHYARLIFGIPAILILLFAAGDYLGWGGWRLVLIALGTYLLAKGFGVEDYLLNSISAFRLSVERLSFVFYLLSIPLFIVAFAQSYEAYATMSAQTADSLKVLAFATSRLLLLLPWALLLIFVGRSMDLLAEKRKYDLAKYGVYGVFVLVLWLIFTVASMWILAEAYFSEFVFAMAYSVLLIALSVRVLDWLRMRIAEKMKLENKEVLNELGAYLGKTVGVDRKKGMLIIQTAFGQKLDLSFEKIVGISDKKVIVRY
jgi:putative membrane protein